MIPEIQFPPSTGYSPGVDHQKYIYQPDFRETKLLERDGTEANVLLQFYSKTIIIVALIGDLILVPFRVDKTFTTLEFTLVRMTVNACAKDQAGLSS